MNLVRVEWFDTVQSADWDTADEVDIKKVHQIGWFLNEHKWSEQGAIKLADTFADGEYYGITAIPKGCVHKVVSITQTSDIIEIF
jgi:hypothetical protein